MTTKDQKMVIYENLTEQLELPETAYLKAKERYEDIGEWLGRDGSMCEKNEPHGNFLGSGLLLWCLI